MSPTAEKSKLIAVLLVPPVPVRENSLELLLSKPDGMLISRLSWELGGSTATAASLVKRKTSSSKDGRSFGDRLRDSSTSCCRRGGRPLASGWSLSW